MKNLLFEGPHFLICDKPSGLVTMGAKEEPSLYAELLKKFQYKTLYTVHRLDKEVSGPVLFAKSFQSYKILSSLFEKRLVKKTYEAYVSPDIQSLFLNEKILEIKAPLYGLKHKSRVDFEKGKTAITLISLKEITPRGARVEITLKTGRFHQIRCHLAYLNFPIIGDKIYSKSTTYLHSNSSALLLRCLQLSFVYPMDSKRYSVSTKIKFSENIKEHPPHPDNKKECVRLTKTGFFHKK